MKKYSIPCLHEMGVVADSSAQVDDHHPLTREEIADLLHAAMQHSDDVQAVSSIQVRLCQGIVGYQCPHLIEGPVAEAQNRIDTLYVKRYHEGASPDLVEELYTLMQV